MKYFKRSGLYKASNVTFSADKIEAFSYGWWRFVGVVEGKVIFNNYGYSNSTRRHQWKVRRLMQDLGIKIDIEMPLAGGILFENETRYKHGACIKGKTLAEMIVEAEETLCNQYLNQELKKQERYERAKIRRAEKRVKLDAEFKQNLDSITHADILAFRMSKVDVQDE
jgi:hypothetical protein